MKNSIITLCLIVVSLFTVPTASAQGSLEFSQALYQELVNGTVSSTYTVPAGKVWKISSIGASAGRTSYTTTQVAYLKTNNAYAVVRIDGYASTSSISCSNSVLLGETKDLLLWLPAGTTLELGFLSSTNSSCNTVYFTGVEFNVLP